MSLKKVKHGIVEFLKPDLVELLKTQKQSKIFGPMTILQKESNLNYYRNSQISTISWNNFFEISEFQKSSQIMETVEIFCYFTIRSPVWFLKPFDSNSPSDMPELK